MQSRPRLTRNWRRGLRRRSNEPKESRSTKTSNRTSAVRNKEDTMSLYGPRQLADSVRTVRRNTIRIAEDIPEKDYGFRPTPDSRSVAETLGHIAILSQVGRRIHGDQRVSSLEGLIIGELIRKLDAEEKRPRSTSETGTLLRAQGTKCGE